MCDVPFAAVAARLWPRPPVPGFPSLQSLKHAPALGQWSSAGDLILVSAMSRPPTVRGGSCAYFFSSSSASVPVKMGAVSQLHRALVVRTKQELQAEQIPGRRNAWTTQIRLAHMLDCVQVPSLSPAFQLWARSSLRAFVVTSVLWSRHSQSPNHQATRVHLTYCVLALLFSLVRRRAVSCELQLLGSSMFPVFSSVMPRPEPSQELWRSRCRGRIRCPRRASFIRQTLTVRCDAEGQGESHWRLARPLKEAVQDRDGLPPILRVCPCRWLDMCSYSLHWAPSSGYMHSSSTSGSSESVLDVSRNKNFVKFFRHLSRECPTQLLARCRMVDSALQKSSQL